MNNDYVYRCSKQCPIRKKCFVIKVKDLITQPLQVMYKCKACKREILISINEGSGDCVIEKEMEGEDG